MQGISLAKAKPAEILLESKIRQLKMLKAVKDQADANYQECHLAVMQMLDEVGRKSAKVGDIKVTKVVRPVTSYDEKSLAKALGAAMWNKITRKVLDKAKLEDKIERGEIDVNVVAAHASVKEASPFLRLSTVLEDEDDSGE